jgi:predicted amidohydrolase YtcJ
LFTVTNAVIYTGDESHPFANSMTIDGGKIVAVDEPPAFGSKVIDAEGKFISAAFGDGHAHPMFAGYEYFGPKIRGLSSLKEILEAVKTFAEANPGLEWIVGGAYDSWIVENGEFDGKWLDEVVSDRPVVLRATDYHTVWCNSKALEIAGIDSETQDPEMGWIIRRPDGTPLGTLREWDAVDLVLGKAPSTSITEKIRALQLASAELLAAGITWVQDAWVDPGMPEAYLQADQQGLLPIRYNLALRADSRTWRQQLNWFSATKELFNDSKNVSCHTIKFFADGVIEGHTAAVKDGYTDDPHNNGMPCWDWQELRECVAAVDALGFQPHIHAIGDEGLTEALNAIEHAQKVNGLGNRLRSVITHVQMLNPLDLPRFERLGVVANFEPLWACNDHLQSELTTPHIGEKRAAWQYPMKSMLKSGAVISMGSDWPVSDFNPMACMEIAVTRIAHDGSDSEAWIPEERITAKEALSAYTRGVAVQAGEEDFWGTIKVGSRADFVILSQNPLEVTPQKIHQVQVLSTWVAGEAVYAHN